VLAAAQLKVLAALPPELRGRAARLRERFLFVAPRWFRRDEPPAALATVAEGVWASRLLEMTYEGPDGPAERRVEPLGLVLKAGVWYLVARRDHLLRTYRVSRILRATCLPERFERPSGFDLAAHWEATASAFEASTRRLDVLVLVRAEAIDELEYATGADVSVLPPEDARGGAVPTATDGWVRAQFQTSSLETVHDDLLRLGARVEVLGPPELRVRLAATVRAMSVVYGASNR
jgi:predicted DNA-binding transcriptional regulator YafY